MLLTTAASSTSIPPSSTNRRTLQLVYIALIGTTVVVCFILMSSRVHILMRDRSKRLHSTQDTEQSHLGTVPDIPLQDAYQSQEGTANRGQYNNNKRGRTPTQNVCKYLSNTAQLQHRRSQIDFACSYKSSHAACGFSYTVTSRCHFSSFLKCTKASINMTVYTDNSVNGHGELPTSGFEVF